MMVVDLADVVGTLAAHAIRYAENGLEVFPVNPHDKTPLVSQYEATVNITTIDSWWTRWPTALIGHRVPPDTVVLDIDPRHGGDATWAALKAEFGPFPITRGHVSGRGDGGGHVWWIRPDDKLSVTNLCAWGRERGTGEAVLHNEMDTGHWNAGIDILHHTHRYTILPPSPHPDTGNPYQWIDGRGLDVQPAPLPAALIDLITDTSPPAPPRPPAAPRDPDSIADWYTTTRPFSQLLPNLGWRLVAGNGDEDRSRWKHPTASSAFSATIRHGYLFCYSPNTPLEVTAPSDPHGYTPFAVYAAYEHRGDLKAAARAAREAKDGPRARADVSWGIVDIDGRTRAVVADHYLPDELWDARPILQHIRQAARSRLVSPDAVLGVILARVAAITPHPVEIPGTIGAAMGLTYYTGIVGPPEAGKSAASQVAAELLPAPPGIVDRLPVGSGEGMVEILFDLVTEEGPDGKKQKVKRQVRNAAIFHIDEGSTLGEVAGRQGSTILSTLRSAYTHGTLGATNASAERKRIVDGKAYVYGITLGIQPELAGPLLADTAAGTPQRFVWLMATDPNAERGVAWPGPLPWEPPDAGNLEPLATVRGGYKRYQLELADTIADEVVADRIAIMRTETTRAAGDAHQLLVRVKTAALLALLDKRLAVDEHDWHLADIITTTSRAIRRAVEGTLRAVDAAKEHAANEKLARRDLHIETTKEHKALASAAKAVANAVAKHTANGEHVLPNGCSKRCATQAMSSTMRRSVPPDDAITEALQRGFISLDGDRFVPGDARPA